jgi:hypothetical protein
MNSTPSETSLWAKIVEDFRQACLLRREGRRDEANQILNVDLPRTIATWSRLPATAPGEDRRSRLTRMFEAEQRRIDDAMIIQRVVSARIEEQILPRLAAEVREAVRDENRAARVVTETGMYRPATARAAAVQRPAQTRIRFDDIPSMIDSVLLDQQLDRGLRPEPVAREPLSPVSNQ